MFRKIISLTILAWSIPISLGASEAPYGHPDYYPSDARPIGFLADGNGWWPGATPVTTFDAQANENIVWKTPLEAGMAQPIVVGEKVFVTGDPNILYCLDVHTGAILWQDDVDHTDAMPADLGQEAKQARAAYEAHMVRYHAYCEEGNALTEALTEAGVQWETFRTGRGKHTSLFKDGSGDAAFDKAMQDSALKKRWEAFLAMQKKEGFCYKQRDNGGFFEKNDDGKRAFAAYKDHASKYSLFTWNNWYGWLTRSYLACCSDGRFVYVAGSNHQVACYDLKGKRQWLVWQQPGWYQSKRGSGGNLLHTRFVKSPLLHKDYLILRADSDLIVLDKKTGKEAWRKVSIGKAIEGKQPFRPTPEAGHPRAFSLPLDGGTLDLVLDPEGQLFRLADGVQVGQTPRQMGRNNLYALIHGDLIVRNSGKAADRGSFSKCYGARMKAESKDKVSIEQLWEIEANHSGLLRDGKVLVTGPDKKKPQFAVDMATGSKAMSYPRATKNNSWISGGGTIRLVHGDGQRDKRWTSPLTFTLTDVTSGATSKGDLYDDRVVNDPAFRAKYKYRGNVAFHSTNACSFQANRIFVRTIGYAWCIGDPTKRFPKPKDCPPEASVP